MRTNRRKLLGALAGTGVVGAAGCVGLEDDESDDGGNDDAGESSSDDGGESSSGNTVTGEADLWFGSTEGELAIIEDAVERFGEETDYEINGSDIAELQDRLTSAIPAGEGPETFFWAHDWVGDFADSGFIVDQSDELDADLDVYTNAGRNSVQYQGGTYGLPINAETVGLFYNKDMVDEAPETISDLQDAMDEFHDPANGEFGLSYPLDPYFYSAYAHAFGGYYFDDESEEPGLTKEETLQGFRVVLEELDPYTPNDPEYNAQAAVFAEGNAPFAINGPWEFGDVDFEVGVAALPDPEGGTAAPYSGIQVAYFADAVTEDPDRAEAARAFAEWYTTDLETLERLANDLGFIPVHEELAGSDDLPETVQGFSESAADGTPMPASPKMNQVWGPVEDGFMNAYTGEQSLKDAFADAEDRIYDNWD